MNPTTSESQSRVSAVQRACDKRGVADIELEWPDGEKQFGRMRLLEWDEHAIYTDRPTYHGMPLELACDLPVTVHFLLDGERYSFRTRIIEECRVCLDDKQAVPGFSLYVPGEVHRDERRHDFRTSLAKCVEVVCEMRLSDSGRQQPFNARVMNISAGGLAVIAVDLNDYEPRRGDEFIVDFNLPGINRKFTFNTEMRHLRNLKGQGFIMGLKFLPDSNAAEMRHAVRQISQFIAKLLKND